MQKGIPLSSLLLFALLLAQFHEYNIGRLKNYSDVDFYKGVLITDIITHLIPSMSPISKLNVYISSNMIS